MSGRPSVSVVVACYNAADYVGEAIDSALRQSVAPLEVVVCDDASTDGSADVLASYGDAVRVVRHAANRGEAASRNSAMQAARGELVAVLDADDTFAPERLERLLEAWQAHPERDVFTSDALIVESGRVLRHYYTPERPFHWDHQDVAILKANFVFGQVLLRRELLLSAGGYDERVRYACDWEAWIRLILGGARVHLVDEPLATYRFHAANSSRRKAAMHEDAAAFLGAVDPEGLRPEQRAARAEGLRYRTTSRDRERMRDALLAGTGTVRPLARAVVSNGEQTWAARGKAALAWASPAVAGRLLARETAREG